MTRSFEQIIFALLFFYIKLSFKFFYVHKGAVMLKEIEIYWRVKLRRRRLWSW